MTFLPTADNAVVKTATRATLFGAGDNSIVLSLDRLWFLVVAPGDGNNQIVAAGAGADGIQSVTGYNSIVLGSGPDMLTLAGTDTITAGAGNDTIDATGAKASMVDGVDANIVFVAGAGEPPFAAAPAAIALSAGAVSLAGGSGNDELVDGAGADTFVGGFGPDPFDFVKGSSGGTDLVINCNSVNETIVLSGTGASAVADALATRQSVGGSVTITLLDATKMTFSKVDHLKGGNFG